MMLIVLFFILCLFQGNATEFDEFDEFDENENIFSKKIDTDSDENYSKMVAEFDKNYSKATDFDENYNGTFNTTCTESTHCSGWYTTCKDGLCACIKKFVHVDGKCVPEFAPMSLLGEVCLHSTDCITDYSRCLCKSGYMKVGDVCVKAIPLRATTTDASIPWVPWIQTRASRTHFIMQLEKRYHATGDKITETYGDACNTTCTHFLVCDDLTKKCICAPRMLYKDGFCIRSRAYDIEIIDNRRTETPRVMPIHGHSCNNETRCNYNLVCDLPTGKCKCAHNFRTYGPFCLERNIKTPKLRHHIWEYSKPEFLPRSYQNCSTHADCSSQVMSCKNNTCVESKTEGRFYNDQCFLDEHCQFPYAICENRTCKCSPSFEYNGINCEPIDEKLTDCTPSSGCTGDENFVCDPDSFKCKCKNGYSYYRQICIPDGYYNGRCHMYGTCNSHEYNIQYYRVLKCQRSNFRCTFN